MKFVRKAKSRSPEANADDAHMPLGVDRQLFPRHFKVTQLGKGMVEANSLGRISAASKIRRLKVTYISKTVDSLARCPCQAEPWGRLSAGKLHEEYG